MCETLFLKQKVDSTMEPKSSEGVARGQSTCLALSGPRIPPSAEFTWRQKPYAILQEFVPLVNNELKEPDEHPLKMLQQKFLSLKMGDWKQYLGMLQIRNASNIRFCGW